MERLRFFVMREVERKLYSYLDQKNIIDSLEAQVREILDKRDMLAERLLAAPEPDRPRVQAGRVGDPVYAAAQKMVDVYAARMDAVRLELVDAYAGKDRIERAVDRAALTPCEREYVELRYFNGMRPSAVAVKMNYSENHLRNIKSAALRKIEAVFKR